MSIPVMAIIMLAAATPATKKPVPRGTPSYLWVTTDDLPAKVLNRGEMVITEYRMMILETGRVGNCEIVQSSGYPILDEKTCTLLVRRARFKKWKQSAEQPIDNVYTGRVRWADPDTLMQWQSEQAR